MNTILGTITWSVDPVAFSLGSLQVRWYGILLATGFVLAYITLQKIFQKENISQKLLDKFAIWTIVWCIVGLRLGHFLFYEPEFLVHHPLQVLLPFDENWHFIGYQGLASHGAAIAIIVWLVYFAWKHKMNFCWLIDRLCIVVPIAAAFVRVGNLMNHEIVGSVTDVAWAFDFTHCSDDYAVFAGKLVHMPTPRHPSQLYEALVYLTLYIGLIVYYFKCAKGRIAPGRTAGVMITTIFTARFFIEFLKADQVAKEATMSLNIGQQLSIPLVAVGIGLLVYSFVKKDQIPQYVEPEEKKEEKK